MALVLTRKSGQSILIGEDIKLSIFSSGATVKVTIDAPKNVKILRSELKGQPEQ